MKNQKVTYLNTGEDTTMTLKILVGETFEDTIVTEKISVDKETGDENHHFILETPSTERQVYRTLADLARDTEEKLEELAATQEPLLELLDDIKRTEEPDFKILDI